MSNDPEAIVPRKEWQAGRAVCPNCRKAVGPPHSLKQHTMIESVGVDHEVHVFMCPKCQEEVQLNVEST